MRSGRIFAVSIPSIQLLKKKTALDYLYPFLSFSVHNFCARTDGQTFFEKVLFFPADQEYIYMSIPISIIFAYQFQFHEESKNELYLNRRSWSRMKFLPKVYHTIQSYFTRKVELL